VRTEASTRGHVLAVMLAYLIVRALRRAWAAVDVTVEEGLKHLTTLCTQELTLPGRKERVHNIPRPRHLSEKLIRAAGVRLPKALPSRSAARLSSPKSELAAGRHDPVVTKRTLPPRRTETSVVRNAG